MSIFVNARLAVLQVLDLLVETDRSFDVRGCDSTMICKLSSVWLVAVFSYLCLSTPFQRQRGMVHAVRKSWKQSAVRDEPVAATRPGLEAANGTHNGLSDTSLSSITS